MVYSPIKVTLCVCDETVCVLENTENNTVELMIIVFSCNKQGSNWNKNK